jgi:subtilisin-like proprotein convertase family protein
MNQKKLFFSFTGFLIAAIFILGFSSNDEEPTSLSPQNPSMEINFINGSNIDMIGVWTSGPPFPVPLADLGGGQGYTRNDTGFVFVIGGEIGLADVRRYNTVTNTWSTVAPLPSGRDRGTTARVKDSLYMVGGANSSNTYTNTLYRYDINGNSWTTKANIPQNIGWGKAVGYQDSLIYLLGGYNGTATLSTVYIYNTISNTWRAASPMPSIRFAGACAISGDTIVYVSGVDGAAIQNTTYRGVIDQSDRTQITWTTGAPLPAPVSSGMFRIDAHSWGNKGIILTGGSADIPFANVSNVCFTYSPGANTWTAQPNKPTAWTAGQSGAVNFSNGIWKLVCASGYGGASQINNTEIFTDTLSAPPGGNSITVCRDGLNKPIPDNGGNANHLRDTIVISGVPAGNEITQMMVTIDSLPHTWVGDIRIWIEKVGGPVDTVISRIGLGTGAFPGAGNSCNDFINTNLVDSAATLIQSIQDPAPGCGNGAGQIMANGYFKPKDPLTGFTNDIDPNGTYIIHISDNAAADVGSLRSWCLTIDYDVLTGTGNNTSIVNDYKLHQNYPNPFNPSTKIKFEIPKQNFVTLKIYDISGREVANLINGERSAGVYDFEFDASYLASGTYFYRLQAGDFVQVKKMVLLK